VMGAELDWSAERIGAEAEQWLADASAEGIDPAPALT
jgi:hypothetical protein